MHQNAVEKSHATKLLLGSLAAFLFAIFMNFLANYLPINGVTTAEVSDRYYNLFTPAGFTFLIWAVIYVSLAILLGVLIWGVIRGRERPMKVISAIGWYFIASSVFNGIWIFTWHYEMMLTSFFVIFGLLVSLILLYRKLKISQFEEGAYLLPFSVYLGWVSVATIANLVAFTISANWGQFGLPSELWFTFLLIAIIGLSAYMIFGQNDYLYGLVILWALSGVSVARWSEFGGVSYPSLIAIIATAVVATLIIRQTDRRLIS
ncbi:hypothetical protein KGY71_05255 [Candidatus Bipolaricaulota bacterium]|nr:hypothetical protein [Candidatus Bipolaricaulota bacterium]